MIKKIINAKRKEVEQCPKDKKLMVWFDINQNKKY